MTGASLGPTAFDAAGKPGKTLSFAVVGGNIAAAAGISVEAGFVPLGATGTTGDGAGLLYNVETYNSSLYI